MIGIGYDCMLAAWLESPGHSSMQAYIHGVDPGSRLIENAHTR